MVVLGFGLIASRFVVAAYEEMRKLEVEGNVVYCSKVEEGKDSAVVGRRCLILLANRVGRCKLWTEDTSWYSVDEDMPVAEGVAYSWNVVIEVMLGAWEVEGNIVV